MRSPRTSPESKRKSYSYFKFFFPPVWKKKILFVINTIFYTLFKMKEKCVQWSVDFHATDLVSKGNGYEVYFWHHAISAACSHHMHKKTHHHQYHTLPEKKPITTSYSLCNCYSKGAFPQFCLNEPWETSQSTNHHKGKQTKKFCMIPSPDWCLMNRCWNWVCVQWAQYGKSAFRLTWLRNLLSFVAQPICITPAVRRVTS